MMKLFTDKVINLVLRGITVLLKFALSIIVIKELSVEDYGVFGLFQSTIIILTFIIGFDFYTFSSREILKKNTKSFSFYFTNQLVFHLLVYIFILPFTYFVFKLGIIDLNFFGSFESIETVITPSDFFNSFKILPSGETIIVCP